MKNPLDLPFERKAEISPIPEGKGMKFHGFIEVNLASDEHPDNRIKELLTGNIINEVREELDNDKVTKFTEICRNGQWNYSFDPPRLTLPDDKKYDQGDWTVEDLPPDQKFELYCGEHRVNGAIGADRETLFFAVVSLEDAYWRITNQSVENKANVVYIKAERTPKQIVMALSKMVEIGKVDVNNEDSIAAALRDLQVKSGEYADYRERLRTEFGATIPIKTYEDNARKAWIAEQYPHITLTTKSKIVPDENKNISISKTFKGGAGTGGLDDSDYDNRLVNEVFDYLINPDIGKISIFASYRGHRGSKKRLKDIRKRKEHLIKNRLEKICQIADAYRKDKLFTLDDIEWLHLPQADGEDMKKEVRS